MFFLLFQNKFKLFKLFQASSLEITLKYFRDLFPDNSIEMPNKMATIYNMTLEKVNDTFFKINANFEILEDFDNKVYVNFDARYPVAGINFNILSKRYNIIV